MEDVFDFVFIASRVLITNNTNSDSDYNQVFNHVFTNQFPK